MLSYNDVISDLTRNALYRNKLSVALKSVRDEDTLYQAVADLRVELGLGYRGDAKRKLVFWEVVSFLYVALAEKNQEDYQSFYHFIENLFRDNLVYCKGLEKEGWVEAFIEQLRQLDFSIATTIYKAISDDPKNSVGVWLRTFSEPSFFARLFGVQSQYSDCFTGEMCTRSWHNFQWDYIVRAVKLASQDDALAILSTLELAKLVGQMQYEVRLWLRDAIDARSDEPSQEMLDLLERDDVKKFFEKEPEIYWGRSFGHRPVEKKPSSNTIEMRKL